MFITEDRLFSLKYSNNKYKNQILSRIFYEELKRFNETNHLDLMIAIQPFFHRLIGEIWQVKFPDGSVMVIKQDGSKGYFINCWESADYSFHRQFADYSKR